MKTIKKLFKENKEQLRVPKSVQSVIPIDTIYDNGIFKVSKNMYSVCFRFTDINYAVASKSDKETMFLKYSELLNSFDSDATTKITVLNRKINYNDF